ncbi:DEHA2D03740p [Debaryomyces hansenii CBS767]|uniref:DEHA2D03740p n=1 Tax=Debaryomyces hansenii (strain ATCC 36239 / CBS 767 / BCRC 21394 / JCM 1990 / NBRC 0083 / IGC 2968) TaxID=284592 RepID=Q6BT40_DEBHA|nr:DEHA2D03740p [Debaryomyces hansenii CBS767]CAG86768.2 DEHA2D03740p [Debaryomyces hansenii CBS767]|eukprot:XP_458630.2 DEHA2D03740p [Debaryomyces hansenii CBS767]
MPDLFDNLFNRIGTKINGGKTTHHYQGSSQVNTGRFYSFHENGTNNKYWMPTSKSFDNTIDKIDDTNTKKERMNSDASVGSEGLVMPRSRMNSAASDVSESSDT